MGGFYINLTGFQKHEVGNAGGKSFRFTELICETENPHGFVLELTLEYKDPSGETQRSITKTLSTCPHGIFAKRKNYFGFEPHPPFEIGTGNRLYVKLIPAGFTAECPAKLLCELVKGAAPHA